ncbi:Aste57867_23344 [Aphanomyces stellatus]|uniref:Aste57867_23344 protein n=1 Tax=Aphanomyces stellatus TaxID=120398 RepID=A0A485LP48_9STRA|nr:hypothetical protein As57867_023273 [Aphanomyces stellatus]VFT99989.1 Aste57867_23344 [Aphanomyces stellatus]
MIPFIPFRGVAPFHRSLQWFLLVPTLIESQHKAAVAFDPWFRTYGISRLDRLLATMPTMLNHVASYAVYFGHLDIVATLARDFASAWSSLPKLLDVAALGGSLPIVETLLVHVRAYCGHVAVVNRLLASFPRTTNYDGALAKAAGANYVDVVRDGQAWSVGRCDDAFVEACLARTVQCGSVEATQWFLARHASIQWPDVQPTLGHLDMLAFVYEQDEGVVAMQDTRGAAGLAAIGAVAPKVANENALLEAAQEATAHGHPTVADWILETRRTCNARRD